MCATFSSGYMAIPGTLLQPALGCFEGGTKPAHFAPKTRRMIHFFEMRQLVQDDVITDEWRGLNQTPVERDGAAPGAGAPTGTLVTNGDFLNAELMEAGQLQDAQRKFRGGKTPKEIGRAS